MAKTITQIAVQKKHKDRCSIFLDNEFGFGLHRDVVFHFGLKKGDVLTDQQIESILFSEEKNIARNRALNWLSFRDRSEQEMRSKLSQAGFEIKIIELVLDDLKRLQLINDEKFALNFVKTRMLTRPMGEYLLKRELSQKGIADELIEKTKIQVFSEQTQFDIARELARKKKKQLQNVEEKKAKKRVNDFLLRRGFALDLIIQIIEQWDNLED